MPRTGHTASGGLLPLWSMAYLPGHSHRTPPLLPHLRRLRLLRVRLSSLDSSFPFYSFVQMLCRLMSDSFSLLFDVLVFYLEFFVRRFIGAVFGSKGTHFVFSIEHFCCDRPNPTLQVFPLQLSFYYRVNWEAFGLDG